MLNYILSIVHNAETLLFGVFISAAFLGIRMSRKNLAVLFGFFSAVGLVYFLSFIFFGEAFSTRIYPLIIHLPLVIFLALYYKYKVILSAISVTTAYLCCQLSKWVGLLAKELTNSESVYYGVRIVTTAAVFVILIKFISNATAQLMQKPTETLLIFALMPFTYYLFDYATGVYTDLLYSGNAVV